MQEIKKISVFGKISTILSTFCFFHCVLTPLLIIFLPTVIGIFDTKLFDRLQFIILILASCFACLSLCWGVRQHGQIWPMICLIPGVLLLTMNIRHRYGLEITIIGTACFVVSQLLNNYLCKNCHKCNHQEN